MPSFVDSLMAKKLGNNDEKVYFQFLLLCAKKMVKFAIHIPFRRKKARRLRVQKHGIKLELSMVKPNKLFERNFLS